MSAQLKFATNVSTPEASITDVSFCVSTPAEAGIAAGEPVGREALAALTIPKMAKAARRAVDNNSQMRLFIFLSFLS